MINRDIAHILNNISEYLAMDDISFKPRAYEKAATSIEALDESVFDIYKAGGIKALENIPAVGFGIAQKIEEYIKTGKIKEYETLKKKIPVNLEELTAVQGIGPKSVLKLYKELNIRDIKDLEKAIKDKKIRKIEGFGQKSEENMSMSIRFLKNSNSRFPLGYVLYDLRKIEERIEKLSGVKKVLLCGSIRRMKEDVGDADILVAVSSDKIAKDVINYFINMPEVAHIYSHGNTKSSVKLRNHINFDLRVVAEESFGAAAQYFTGSKNHNIELRKIAIKKGLKLNEYGFSKEEEVYETLGLQWIPPELRENAGEIEASQQNKLPKLIGYQDLKGDLQMHSKWSDGQNTIEEMAKKAMAMGLEYIAITDHLRGTLGNLINEKDLLKQWEEIDKLNANYKKRGIKFRILKGGEVEILNNGKLFMRDEILEKLDVVGAAIHTHAKMTKEQMTEIYIKVMKNPNVDIIFHPTGRLIGIRPPREMDIGKIIRAAKETKTVLEIDAYYNRLDLKDEYARIAKNAGVKIAIDSDAHNISHFQYLELGIAQARRGWLEKKDVINAWPVEKMLEMLK
ncbi:DNA polymerase/3'-5' exonuclease PolX [Patescibacteria group bacterium]|nr:DNA polymerase/3'-5' exonuclease PolX [Patescibacteria group bacterium]MBU4458695.1 DNA polymerase/3'-5' exonuclease PolX [Patescibacteria group bacterium]MCG2696290.1 DNA polymerase/3'-5' exonuclease PolX [Candidatus Portnoybacteria bacterium]